MGPPQVTAHWWEQRGTHSHAGGVLEVISANALTLQCCIGALKNVTHSSSPILVLVVQEVQAGAWG